METITGILGSGMFILIFLVGIVVIMAILLEFEREGWATTLFSLGLALIMWNYRGDIWNFLTTRPATTFGFAASYVVVGIVWSFVKWRAYVKSVFDRFLELKSDFVRDNGPITLGNQKKFNKTLEYRFNKNGESDNKIYSIPDSTSLQQVGEMITPWASKKKTIITAWIGYWPMSMAGTLLNNPFRRFFEWVYGNLSGYYDKVAHKYKRDIFEGL